MGFSFAAGVLGAVVLAHAAHATIQYRSYLKIIGDEFSGPPFAVWLILIATVVLELLAGLGFFLWAALTVPGKFLSIRPQDDENRVVALPANLDFMIFSHRGKAFPLAAPSCKFSGNPR